MRRASLARRVVASSLIGLVLLLLLGGAALSWAFRRSAESAFDERLDAWSQAVVAALAVAPDGGLAAPNADFDPRFEQPLSGWYWAVSDGGERLASSRSLWDDDLPAIAPPADGAPAAATITGPRGRALRALARRVTIPGRDAPLVVQVAVDAGELRREVERFDVSLLAALGLLGAAILALGALQLRLALRPLATLADEIEAVRRGERDRVGDGAPRELGSLADSLNALLAHDADLVRRARDRAADLAHALKTPLSLVRSEAEEIGGERGARIARHADAMARHVERRLAAAAATPAVAAVRTPVEPVLRAIADTLGRLHPGCRVELEVPPALAFRGPREDLEEIAGNLLENACKWARSRARVAARAQGARFELAVEDDGAGLDVEQRERARARGARLDEHAPGTGLGLAIVEEVAAAHGGRLALGASPLGGLRAAVDLPAAS